MANPPIRFQWIKYKGQWTVARIERKDDDWAVHVPGETACLGDARTEKILGPAVADIDPTNGVPLPFDPWTGAPMPPPVRETVVEEEAAPSTLDPPDEDRRKVLRLIDILGAQVDSFAKNGVMPASIRPTPHTERDIDVIIKNEERNLAAFRDGDVAVAEEDLKRAQRALVEARSRSKQQ